MYDVDDAGVAQNQEAAGPCQRPEQDVVVATVVIQFTAQIVKDDDYSYPLTTTIRSHRPAATGLPRTAVVGSVVMNVQRDGSDRTWRTRDDAFAEDWDEIVKLLEVMPELQGVRLFDCLREKFPGRYEDGQLRTLQRRVWLWRA